MKLVKFLYLEDDEPVVDGILEETGVGAFSRLGMEGHGGGIPGWYGDVPSFRSRLIFTWVSPEQAREVLDAVARARGVQSTAHPIHALQVDVETMASSGLPPLDPVRA